MDIFQTKLILASQSPRRKELLQQAGFSFSVQPLDADESFPENMDVYEVAAFLAAKKAQAGKHLLSDKEILVTADSVVIYQNQIFNKPENEQDAFQMIKSLSGDMHEVCTGVCLLSKSKKIIFTGHSKVYMAEMTDEEIQFYIKQYRPFDKAGAYGIQEWIGLCKIKHIEGTYPNVMGLPTDLFYKNLKEMIKAD